MTLGSATLKKTAVITMKNPWTISCCGHKGCAVIMTWMMCLALYNHIFPSHLFSMAPSNNFFSKLWYRYTVPSFLLQSSSVSQCLTYFGQHVLHARKTGGPTGVQNPLNFVGFWCGIFTIWGYLDLWFLRLEMIRVMKQYFSTISYNFLFNFHL